MYSTKSAGEGAEIGLFYFYHCEWGNSAKFRHIRPCQLVVDIKYFLVYYRWRFLRVGDQSATTLRRPQMTKPRNNSRQFISGVTAEPRQLEVQEGETGRRTRQHQQWMDGVGNFTATLIHSKISLLHTFVRNNNLFLAHSLLCFYFFIDDVRIFQVS